MKPIVPLVLAFGAGLILCHGQEPARKPEEPAPSSSPTEPAPPGDLPVKPAEPVPVQPALPVQPTPTPAPAPTPTAREVINGLSEQQLEQAVRMIRENFLDPARTDDKELRRATLEGLLQRIEPGAIVTLETPAGGTPEQMPFVAEILDSRIGYIRLGALDKESLAQMDASLASFNEKRLRAVILDLRAAPHSGDFEAGAEFARRFCEKGKLLFSIEKPSAKQERIFTSNQDPAFSGVLVVLTDDDTAGAAEALAATLRLNANAMIVGADTSGEAVEFADVPLGDGKLLRVAVAQVTLPESGAIYPEGVKPDIAVSLTPARQEEIFRLSREKGVSQFVFENERPRMNEAALIANTNPEIELTEGNSRGRPQNWDTVLQRAVDLVTAISFYKDKKP
jgi:hypothetical protein